MSIVSSNTDAHQYLFWYTKVILCLNRQTLSSLFNIKITTMKTIIVATDFSTVALNAAEYAVKMANTLGADVLLFNVYEVLPNYGEIVFNVDVEELKRSARAEIQKLKKTLLNQANINFNIGTEISMGLFKDELIKVCETVQPYAVIMGSQGKSKTEHFLMGSHAGKMINHFAWPIITVPPTAKFSAIKKIAIAYDFELVIQKNLINDIKLLAKDFNASIDILNAEDEADFNENFVFLSRTLEDAFKPINIKYDLVTSHHSDEGILKFVDENNIDLLVVMPKHHNLLEKWFQKSHTKNLVLHSHVPVMELNE